MGFFLILFRIFDKGEKFNLCKKALKYSQEHRSGLLTHTHTQKHTHTQTQTQREREREKLTSRA